MFNPFQMKMMLHYAHTAQFDFRDTLSRPRTAQALEMRERGIQKYICDLLEKGLIQHLPGLKLRDTGQPHAQVLKDEIVYDYVATPKGRVFINAVLNTPLPVPSTPEWVMPNA